MRTAWKCKGLTISAFMPCKITHSLPALTSINPMKLEVTYYEGTLLGTFRITGIHTTNADLRSHSINDPVLIAVIQRNIGCSFHDATTGVNLSDGCFTLSNDRTAFNPALLRYVIRYIDCSKLERRTVMLLENGFNVNSNIVPFQISMEPFEASCPRCCEDFDEQAFKKMMFLSNASTRESFFQKMKHCKAAVFPFHVKCPECGISLLPYI